MSNYIPSPNEPLPQFGGDRIEHHLKIIEGTDLEQVETDTDAFFASLSQPNTGTPYIRLVNSHVTQPQQQAAITYTVIIHYVLVV